MRYIDVCSGISAPTMAWKPLGWQALCFAEIEAAPRAVLAHHYPDVPLNGDFTHIKGDEYGPVDLLVGGTPCQSFSVAGLRGGLDDERGNLALEYLRLADRARPRWLVWENVPGVLSSNEGRDFGTFLGALGELGYGFAYAVLDAQHFGVPQRRRRVFVVGYLGDWHRAAAVLFERHSLCGHSAPRREKGERVAPTISARPTGGGGLGTDFGGDGGLIPQGCGGEVAPTLNAEFGSKLGLDNQHIDSGAGLFVNDTMGTITARMFNALGSRDVEEGAVIPVAFDAYNQEDTGDVSKTVAARADQDTASVVLDDLPTAHTLRGETLRAGGHTGSHANAGVMPAVAYPINADALQGEGSAKTPSQDAAGRVRLRDPGLGIGDDGDPAGALSASGPGAVAYAIQERAVSENLDNGPQGKGFQPDTAYTLEARNKVQAVAFQPRIGRNGRGYNEDVVPALNGADAGATSDMRPCVAFTASEQSNGFAWERDVYPTLNAQVPNDTSNIQQGLRLGSAVRRLTPRECERLQGFPDDFTLVPYRGKLMADGPRYKMLGNSMAVPVLRWIGERIAMVEALDIAGEQGRAA